MPCAGTPCHLPGVGNGVGPGCSPSAGAGCPEPSPSTRAAPAEGAAELRAPRAGASPVRVHLNPGRAAQAAAPCRERLPRDHGGGGGGVYLARDQPIFVATSGERALPLSVLPAPAPPSRRRAPLSGGTAAAPLCLLWLSGQSEEHCETPKLSPPSTEMTAAVAFLLLSLLRMAAPEGVWCPACGLAALTPTTQRDVLIALAKQSILSKLRLPDRPNITQPTSKGVLLTALRRMHARRVDTAFSPGMPRGGSDPHLRLGLGLQEYEILSFAESGSSTSRSALLHFHFAQELAGSTEILHATLYLFWAVPGPGTHPVTVRLLQPDLTGLNMTMASETQMEVQRAGWATLDVSRAVQSLFVRGSQRLTVELEVAEDWGSPLLAGHSDSHWPFVAAQARARTPHRVQRRGIDCSGDSQMCCRQEFFVDFKEIGWEDWIIQPEGYHMNYCAGLCPLHMAGIPGLAASFHTAVANLIKANNADAAVDSCCVPTQRRPLSLLYYDRDSNIVKTDIPDMIVDACGCT
uniref:Inhibin subunit beta C n=1 Tax=Falco tinnunculus TaxID=100819 RepID=A0A8C4U6C1_FALTI